MQVKSGKLTSTIHLTDSVIITTNIDFHFYRLTFFKQNDGAFSCHCLPSKATHSPSKIKEKKYQLNTNQRDLKVNLKITKTPCLENQH